MGNRWSLSLIPEETAFGILSVLLPLYIIEEINGSLLHVGLIFFVKSFVQIPATILWARWVDKKGKCKIFILMSFLISSLTIFLFTTTNSVLSFLSLNVVLSIFYAAHVPATRILIAESVPSSAWTGGFAQHRLVLGLGAIIGLFTGALWMTILDNRSLMLLCSVLVFASVILSVVLMHDPLLMIERKMVRFERFADLAEEAYRLAYAPPSHARVAVKRYLGRYPNPKPLILGIFLFPLASSMVFTSIPIFLSANIGASPSLIFYILLNKSISVLIGYILIRTHKQKNTLKTIKTASLLRTFFPILILISAYLPFHLSLMLSSLALAIAGFAWPHFSVASTVLWMQSAPKGTEGIYGACMTSGTALGSLLGGFIPSFYGFEMLFALSACIYGTSLFLFAFSTLRGHI